MTIDLDIFTRGEDLDIALYADPDFTELIAESTGENHAGSMTESFTTACNNGGIYFLRVFSPGEGPTPAVAHITLTVDPNESLSYRSV